MSRILVPAMKVSHRIWSWSEKRRLEELDKTQVMCYSCHKAKTFSENGRHGRSRYEAGCRCFICKEAKSVANARRATRGSQEARRYAHTVETGGSSPPPATAPASNSLVLSWGLDGRAAPGACAEVAFSWAPRGWIPIQ